eukprot:TRINITY_DN1028_c0_g1_i10.p1 TRINITY_DN1028_c0_g1~~TRINITY_DN1028_c0_g1_i10.p1  ORF type:complete len:240 (+),score=26.44 TRINITY_DN1028_c0_g1_i10:1101-1820(+)
MVMEKNKEGVIDFPEEYWKDVSKEARELVELMLHRNPNKRITAELCLQHSWLDFAHIGDYGVSSVSKEIKKHRDSAESGRLCFEKIKPELKKVDIISAMAFDGKITKAEEEICTASSKQSLFIPTSLEDDNEEIAQETRWRKGAKSFSPGSEEERVLPVTPGARCKTKQSMEMCSSTRTLLAVSAHPLGKKYSPSIDRNCSSDSLARRVPGYNRKPSSSKDLISKLNEFQNPSKSFQDI